MTQPLRILHVNASSSGGAFVVAQRLVDAQNTIEGIQARHFVFTGQPGAGYELFASSLGKKAKAFAYHAAEKAHFLAHEASSAQRFLFSHAWVGLDEIPGWQEADILHLHWVNKGLLSMRGLQRLIDSGKPIVWTCHDLWPFTGGCYHPSDCQGLESHCQTCPLLKPGSDLAQRRLAHKQRLWAGQKQLQFVAPSAWLAGKAARSAAAQDLVHEIQVIPNGIDALRFAPGDAAAERRRWNLDPEATVLLFSSANLANPYKGFPEFVRLFNGLIEAGQKVQALLVGQNRVGDLGLNGPHVEAGFLSDADDLVSVYRAADLYVTPTRNDNLPTTVMEALSCGTPVLAFGVGGIPEMVQNGKTGWVIEPGDSEGLFQAAQAFMTQSAEERRHMATAARAFAQSTYAHEAVLEQYQALYRSVRSH